MVTGVLGGRERARQRRGERPRVRGGRGTSGRLRGASRRAGVAVEAGAGARAATTRPRRPTGAGRKTTGERSWAGLALASRPLRWWAAQ